MKIRTSTIVVLLSHVLSSTANEMLDYSIKVAIGQELINNAVDSMQNSMDMDQQPICKASKGEYIVCMDMPDDIDDTLFVAHPTLPEGSTVASLEGTAAYDITKGMVETIRATLSDCHDVGSFASVKYDWVAAIDNFTPIIATSMVKDFMVGDDTYICATAPLAEDPKPEPMTTMEVNMKNAANIPVFEWAEAPPGGRADFVGNLEMCGGVANHIGWPEYFANELISGAVFAYRQYGVQTGLCGSEMSPVMRLTPGKVYKINFINSSGTDTNLHTHGLHLGGNYWSDDVFRTIPAGMCGVYYWEIMENHSSGMHWYHPHLHGYTFEQVRGRAFGPLWVEETQEKLETYPRPIQKWLDNAVMLQMSTDTVPGPMSGGMGVKDGRCPNTVAGRDDFTTCFSRANNKRVETVTMIKDEWYSVTVHNIVPNGTGMDVIQFFSGDGTGDAPCTIMIAGYDGVYRSSIPRPVDDYPEIPNYFHCNGASRLLLAMKCSADATMKLAKEDKTDEHYQMSTESHKIPILVKFNIVEGEKTEASPYANEDFGLQWKPPRPQYLEDLTTWEGEVETWESKTKITNLETGDRMQMVPLFNDQSFEGGDPNHVATYGAVQEWSFFGTAGAPEGHPMHVHVNHMQIYGYGRDDNKMVGEDCGPNFEFGEWYDTIRIRDSTMDPCLARFRFNNFSGKVIMHCHDLMHEDGGMMGWVRVDGGPQDDIADIVVDPIVCENLDL